jgi:hypothetical protein
MRPPCPPASFAARTPIGPRVRSGGAILQSLSSTLFLAFRYFTIEIKVGFLFLLFAKKYRLRWQKTHYHQAWPAYTKRLYLISKCSQSNCTVTCSILTPPMALTKNISLYKRYQNCMGGITVPSLEDYALLMFEGYMAQDRRDTLYQV